MRKQATAILALFLAAPVPGTRAADFLPDPDGWIRHWIVYGPIGRFGDKWETKPPEPHPITLEPLLFSDFIAEAEGKEGRWTEKNFLPAPGKEIDTAFGTVRPGHILRPEAGAGINPDGKPMGIGLVACGCGVDIESAFAFPPSENDGPENVHDVCHYVTYAYTYVENLTGEPIVAYPTFDTGDAHTVHVSFGSLPSKAGDDFLEVVYEGNERLLYPDSACPETVGPPPLESEPGSENRLEGKKITLEPGMNLFLFKNYAMVFGVGCQLRLRSTIPPYPPITEGIRIRLHPDPARPDPVLFRRMDADVDGSITIADAVLTAMALFLGAEPLACPDAADANDDGKLDLSDPIGSLRYLFLGGDPPPFPRGCCGLDPTEDDLAECAPAEKGC